MAARNEIEVLILWKGSLIFSRFIKIINCWAEKWEKRAFCETKSLQQLVGELNAGRRLTVEPSTFVQAVHDQLPNFNGHIQQDVQEFFCQVQIFNFFEPRFAFSAMANKNCPKNNFQLLYKLEKERTKGCSEDILNCVVNRMFTGQWQSEVICTQCSNSNLQIEKFNTLPLEFPNKYYKNIGSQVQ